MQRKNRYNENIHDFNRIDGAETMDILDLEILHTFVIVTDTGSYTKASTILFKSQSAISEQIQKLELFCGAQLLSRGRHGANPTATGKKLYQYARSILSMNTEIVADIRKREKIYELTLSITDYFMPNKIAPILKGLRDQYQNIQFNVSIQSSSKIMRELSLNQYDVALLANLSGQQLPDTEDYLIVGREALCWAGAKDFNMTGYKGLPIITLPKGCLIQKLAIEKLENNKIEFNLLHHASSVVGMQSAIEAQLGIGCLNKSSMTSNLIDYTEILQLPKLPEIEYVLYYKTEKLQFIDSIKALVESLTGY